MSAACLISHSVKALQAESSAVDCQAGRARIVATSGQPVNGSVRPSQPEIVIQSTDNAHRVSVHIVGPMLGAMDSQDVVTHLQCTGTGFQVLSRVTRSADYGEAVLANVIWRPTIDLLIDLTGRKSLVTAIWTMQLSTGGAVKQGNTLPGHAQTFPMNVSKEIHAGDGSLE